MWFLYYMAMSQTVFNFAMALQVPEASIPLMFCLMLSLDSLQIHCQTEGVFSCICEEDGHLPILLPLPSSVSQSECFGGLQLQSAVIHWSIVGVVIKCGKGKAFYDFMIKSFSELCPWAMTFTNISQIPFCPLKMRQEGWRSWRQRDNNRPR